MIFLYGADWQEVNANKNDLQVALANALQLSLIEAMTTQWQAAGHQHTAGEMEAALRRAGVRITRQRAALLKVLAAAEDHPDANELHRRAQSIEPNVSLSTVYRTLTRLEEEGVIHRHAFEGEPARFETADQPHHDHLIDVDSGEVIEFQSEKIERLQAEIAAELGYDIVRHRLELYVRRRNL